MPTAKNLRRLRKDHSAEHFSSLTRLTLNLLKTCTKYKVGIQAKRKVAAWDPTYLLEVLTRQ